MSDEDRRLMEQVAQGDRDAFARLFDRHQAAVVRFCARFSGSVARAEELAQDVFVKLYRSAARYRPQAQFRTFLFRIAANHCLNEGRRDARTQLTADGEVDGALDAAGAAAGPDGALEGKELAACVERALAAMSDRERTAFSLCRFEGLPYREIAQVLDASEPAVKSLIHRAGLTLMKHVEAHERAAPAQEVRSPA